MAVGVSDARVRVILHFVNYNMLTPNIHACVLEIASFTALVDTKNNPKLEK